MITFIKLVCPSCGANLEADSKLSQCFCQYCGTKILLHNENEYTVNINQTNRFVNEAELAKQENERRRIEFEQKKYADKKAENKNSDWLSVIGMILAFGSLMSAWLSMAGIFKGGFLCSLVSILNIIPLAGVWYGFYALTGKSAVKPKIGMLIMVASIILCALFFSIVIRLLPPA